MKNLFPMKNSAKRVHARIGERLKELGFNQENRFRFVLHENEETDIFFYPGISVKKTYVEVNPVVGVDNVPLSLRWRAAISETLDPRVCHVFLGELDGVNQIWEGTASIYLFGNEDSDAVINLVINDLRSIGLPLMRRLNSSDKVKQFLAMQSTPNDLTSPFHVGDIEQKLNLLSTN
jgi:hypothetical protein